MLKRHVSGDERSMNWKGNESSKNGVVRGGRNEVNEFKQKMLYWIVSSL